MTTVQDIYRMLDEKAPFSSQMSFDNSGHLVGDPNQPVHRVLVSLDITEAVAEEAIRGGYDLIVAHHPLIFSPVKQLTTRTVTGRILMQLVRHGISAICCHTNLDMANGGVNDCLAEALELTEVCLLAQEGTYSDGSPYGIGRVGMVPGGPCALSEFLNTVLQKLQPNGLRYADAGRPVHRVAVGGGACGEYMQQALALGCDTFLTSDLKYHGFWDGKDQGINLIDAGHYPTENPVCSVLIAWLQEAFPQLQIAMTQVHTEVISYLLPPHSGGM